MTEQRCVIIGASPDTHVTGWTSLLQDDDYIICADGGYIWAQKAGFMPRLIIGDFDSAPLPTAFDGEIIRLPVQKDDTDTMYCIKEGIRRGFRTFLLLGMTGGRPDHTFANYAALCYLSQRGLYGEMIGNGWCYRVLTDETAVLSGYKNSGFAVFPFGCHSCRVSLSGFLYEGDGIDLSAGFPLGVSNTITDDAARVQVAGTALILFQQK